MLSKLPLGGSYAEKNHRRRTPFGKMDGDLSSGDILWINSGFRGMGKLGRWWNWNIAQPKNKGEAASAPPKVFVACVRVSYGSLELFYDYCSVNHAILMAGRTLTYLSST